MQQFEILFRDATIKSASIDQQKRTAELSFSSETPILRNGAYEVLSHDTNAVDMSALNGASLLLDHDGSKVVGVIENARLANRKGLATARFSKSPLGEETFQDVVDGIRRQVSVGASIEDFSAGKTAEGTPIYKATKWTPREVSLVGIPADPKVGIGRRSATSPAIMAETTTPTAAQPVAQNNVEIALASDRSRISEINAMAEMVWKRDKRNFTVEAKKAVMEGWSPDQFGMFIAKSDRMQSSPEGIIGAGPEDTRGFTNRSVGEQVVNHEAFKSVFANGRGLGRNQSITLHLPEFRGFTKRGTLESTGLTSIEKLPDVKMLGVQRPTVAQLMSGYSTNNTDIRYIQEQSITNAAGTVLEGGAKPEASFSLAEIDANVRKVAVFARVSDELLMDYERLQGYINMRLQWMIEMAEEAQLLNGNGTAPNLLGILNAPGVQNYIKGTGYSAESDADAIFKGMTAVRTIGFFEPTAIVLHPADWQNIRLSKDANGQYYGGGPMTAAYGNDGSITVDTLWGKPVIHTMSATQGTALVGAFPIGGEVYRRQGLIIEMSNQEGSNFVNNLTTIRAETRLTLAVPLPLAFCTVTNL